MEHFESIERASSHASAASIPMTKAIAKYAGLAVVVVLLTAAGTAFLAGLERRVPPVTFGRPAVVTPSSANLVSIGITNQGDTTIVYLACPPQVKSNGIWSPIQIPPGKPMATLSPGQSGLITVEAAPLGGASRVPVLWGYTYSRPTSKWVEIREDVFDRITGRNPGGRGALYTNYTAGFRLR